MKFTTGHRNMAGKRQGLIGRRGLSALVIASASIGLAGCGPVAGLAPPPRSEAPRTAYQELPAAAGERGSNQIGSGPTKIALILPMTQSNGASNVGASLRNAAEMAVADSGGNDVTVLVKDDHSTTDGARDATQQALTEGADVILGPLFAPNVRETARLARNSGKTVIAFSTDSSVASHGVYLLSFLVENYVDRIVDFAASKGKRSFAAMIPNNDYGRVAEAEFSAVAARKGVRVMAIEHYTPGSAGEAAKNVAALGDQVDALFIPDQAEGMSAVSQALTSAGISSKKIQLLGTGVWNDARVLKLPALQGAWFATPENGGFNNFAQRYRAKFGSDPTRIATLAYDGTSLLAALARQQGARGFSDGVLTNGSGFNGADGVFRFRPDGLNERGLAVLSVAGGSVTVLSPAPKNFSASPSGT